MSNLLTCEKKGPTFHAGTVPYKFKHLFIGTHPSLATIEFIIRSDLSLFYRTRIRNFCPRFRSVNLKKVLTLLENKFGAAETNISMSYRLKVKYLQTDEGDTCWYILLRKVGSKSGSASNMLGSTTLGFILEKNLTPPPPQFPPMPYNI